MWLGSLSLSQIILYCTHPSCEDVRWYSACLHEMKWGARHRPCDIVPGCYWPDSISEEASLIHDGASRLDNGNWRSKTGWGDYCVDFPLGRPQPPTSCCRCHCHCCCTLLPSMSVSHSAGYWTQSWGRWEATGISWEKQSVLNGLWLQCEQWILDTWWKQNQEAVRRIL